MPAVTHKVLLVTDDQSTIDKISTICQQISSDSIHFLLLNDADKVSSADIILISDSKIEDYLANKILQALSVPIFYLEDGKNSLKNFPLIEERVEDNINMDKITVAGFNRAIRSALEKHQVLSELKSQQALLSEYIGALNGGSVDLKKKILSEGTLNLHSLINENKHLIEKIKTQNMELKRVARIDSLTNIANRRSFDEALIRTIGQAKRHNHLFALLIMDLDKFKDVNDSLGHQIGDKVLQAVSERIQNVLRRGDFVARIGGDEFAVILPEIKNMHAAGIVAAKLIKVVSAVYHLQSHEILMTASIGIACFPLLGKEAETLVKNADIAMYLSKKAHDVKYTYATVELQQDHLQRLVIETELREAIKRNEFKVVYQPIYELASGNLHGFEALLRWHNGTLGQVPPDLFIPIAEDLGLINSIGKWVLDAVCKQIAAWGKTMEMPYKFAINLSPVQLRDESLLSMISETVENYQLPYSMFEFEVTEMAIMYKGIEVSSTMEKLFKLGASHALDDFGTGYSSISHLKYLPITTIKIDRSFISGLNSDKTDNDIVSSIIALGKKMGLKVVAEGVETQEQLEVLLREECDYVQGYLFSKPIPAEEVFKHGKILVPNIKKMDA